VAVVGTAAAALLRSVIGNTVGEIPAFITFYPVALASAAIGGTGPGLLATLLTALAATYFFIGPRGQLAIAHTQDAVALGIFVAINIAISLVGGRLRTAHQRVKTQNEQLERSDEQLRLQATALQSTANAIVITDRQGAIQWTNEAFTRLTGYAPAEALGQNPRLLNSDRHDTVFYKQMWETILAGRVWHGELVNQRKDSSLYTEDMTITPVQDSRGAITHFIAVKQDVTLRKEAEARMLALSQRRAADLAAMQRLHELSTHFLSSQGDLQPLLRLVLDAALAITAAAKGHIQLLNASTGELAIASESGYDPAFLEFFRHVRPGRFACGTAVQTRRCVIVEDVTLSPLFLVEPRALELTLAAGVRAMVCTPLLAHTGELVGVLSAHFASPHRPADRDLRLLDLLARQAADFVERAQAEAALRGAKDQLARANADLERTVQERTAKLRETIAELEGFSYSITHDMRAPLRALQNFATLAEEECAGCARPRSQDYFRRIRAASHRLDRLIQDSLDYNKIVRQELPLIPVDAAKLLRGLIEAYPNLQPSGADIRLEFDGLLLLGNESALTQVFANLLGNAVKFVAPGVQPRVRIWGEAPSPQPLNPNHQVRLWIEDNGIGIPKAAHEKIFGMFQRMHHESDYPGTGIGLAIARKAVERMGGRIGLESEPGKGSRFWIELPVAVEATAASTMENAA
jgi:PAS domain S-box-containing protein